MYVANDTFDDGRDEDTSQNNVVTNKSKDKQVLKTCLKSKDIEQTLLYCLVWIRFFEGHISEIFFASHIPTKLFKRTI